MEVPSGDGVLRADRHPIYLIVSLAIAMLLNRSRGRGVTRTLLYLPAIIPTIAVAMIWKWLTDPSLGVLNNLSQLVGLNVKLSWFYSEAYPFPTFIPAVDLVLRHHLHRFFWRGCKTYPSSFTRPWRSTGAAAFTSLSISPCR